MTDDELDLGPADGWARVLARREASVERMPLTQILTVERVSVSGPASTEEAQAILADPALQRLLRTAWRDDPPAPELRATLMADPYGRSLLSLAPVTPDSPASTETAGSEVSGGLLERLLARAPRIAVPAPMAHAAASAGALPLVFTSTDDDARVRVEGRGNADRFALVVTSTEELSTPRFVVVYVDPEADAAVFAAPLRTGPDAVATVLWTRYPDEVAVDVLPDDLTTALAEPEVRAAVIAGVRAADGATQEAWRDLARSLGPGSPVYDAVVEGFR